MSTINSAPRNEYQNFNEFCLYSYLKRYKSHELDSRSGIKSYLKGEYIYQPPVSAGYIYQIIEGAVKLGSYTETGTEFVHDIVHAGDYFGNLKYLNNQFFEFSKTLTGTKIRRYQLNYFKTVVPEDPLLAEWFMSYLVKRWCISEKKIKIIKEKNLKIKLKSLRSLYNIPIKDIYNDTHILFDLLTQQELGDIAGVSRQTISLAQKSE